MGRPLKYTNPDDMQALIHLYFLDCKKNREAEKNGGGEPKDTITEDLHPTVTGLALVLDLTREGLINYEQKEEFSDTIKRAKTRVEAYTAQRLFMNNPTGSIFNLKNNFNWKDKTETAHTGPGGGPIRKNYTIKFIHGNLTDRNRASSETGEVADNEG